jgi:16S rRNA (guanine527-N7)-methyltransferase
VNGRSEAERLLPDVSRETWERAEQLVAILLKWQPRINLVASSTLADVWLRHVADSLQLVRAAPKAKTWVDLGSGAGFPGLLIAAARPEAEVHLVESDQRKCAFMREAARAMGFIVRIHNTRIEACYPELPERADAVSARALAALPKLLQLAAPLIESGAKGVFPKGREAEAELTAARESWNIEAELVPSISDPHASVIVVSGLSPRPVQQSGGSANG